MVLFHSQFTYRQEPPAVKPEAPGEGRLGGLPSTASDPLLSLRVEKRDGVQVAVAERGKVPPRAGLVPDGPGEGDREVRAILTDVLPDRGIDAAGPDHVSGFVC